MTLPTEANFVIDLLEFEQDFKMGRRNLACLTRPLEHYRYLALAALQSVLNNPGLIRSLRKPASECIGDYYEGLYEVLMVKAKSHFKDRYSEHECDLVCQYLASLVHYLALTVTFHYPGLVYEAGQYAVTVAPVVSRSGDVPLTSQCLRIRLQMRHYPTGQTYQLGGPDTWNLQ